ncbi:hypothetical protein B566_EDAN008097 [Ephemera danica]|nr:hypothetical protein B566_EDAN008097 [Ephemera danica]
MMPGDIDVVAAIGDSLIAGMGGSASTQIGSLIEDRGYSWGIGGKGTWRDALTLPNILRQFNPNLLGYSTGTGTAASKESWLNVAEPGALFRQMPYMARVLVDRIRLDVFATEYDFPAFCYLPHRISCPCLFGPRFDKNREYMSKIAADVQRMTIDLVSRENFDKAENFTVILQPFSEYTRLPFKNYSRTSSSREPDLIDLAPDCFHFSQHGCAKGILPKRSGTTYWNQCIRSPPSGHNWRHI